MTTYLERYIASEREAVWDELLALGAGVREEPLYADALAIARATMTRARHNVELLVARLRENGYVFIGRLKDVYKPPDADAPKQVATLEELFGPIPLSIRIWYEYVGEVDLSGTHLAWKVRGYVDPINTSNPIWYIRLEEKLSKPAIETEPLQVYSVIEQFSELERLKDTRYSHPFSFALLICDDMATRSNFSGGNIVVMNVDDKSIDGFVYEQGKQPSETFAQYLRRSFMWGGFPGFANVDERLRPTKWLAELTEGLLPI